MEFDTTKLDAGLKQLSARNEDLSRVVYFNRLSDYLSHVELAYVQKSYWLVKDAHRHQSRRLTNERYFNHVRRVSLSSLTYNYTDVETITLGLLHDVVEDTYVPAGVLLDLFGRQMYGWVQSLSKEIPVFDEITGKLRGRTKLPDDVYYGDLLESVDVYPRRVKCLDRLDNTNDLETWEAPRRLKYLRETVDRVIPIAARLDHRLRIDLEAKIAPFAHELILSKEA